MGAEQDFVLNLERPFDIKLGKRLVLKEGNGPSARLCGWISCH